jgi:ABC-2 type transport system permease protein
VVAALVHKETAQVFREPMQWTQLVIVVSLVMVYLFSIQKLPIQHEALRLTVAFINLGAVMFILTSFALRFVFVQPSLEYRTVWLLKAAPIPLRAVFLTKAALYLPVMLILGLTMSLASNTLLGVPRVFNIIGVVAVCVAGVALTVAAYSFGVMFPKTEFQTIADVETSFGGVSFLVMSLFYIVFSVVSFAHPVREFILGRAVSAGTVAFHGAVFVLVNAAYAVPVGMAGWRRFTERFG